MAVFLGLILGFLLFAWLVSRAYEAEGGASTSLPGSSGGRVSGADPDAPSALEIVEQHYAAGFLQCLPEELLRMTLGPRGLPILLREGEVILGKCSTAGFAEERSERFYGGGSVRVVRGVRVFAAAGRSIPRLTPTDQGLLLLTNRRLVFLGNLRNLEVPLARLSGLRYEPGTLEVYEAGRAKKLHFHADECTAVIGRKLECLLDGGEWFVSPESEMLLVRRGGPADPSARGGRPAEGDRPGGNGIRRGRAIAAALASVAFADGTLTAREVAAIERAIADDELGLGPAEQQKVADEFDGLLREMRAGSAGPFLEEAVERLRREPQALRRRIWQLCLSLVDLSEGSGGEESGPVRYLTQQLLEQEDDSWLDEDDD